MAVPDVRQQLGRIRFTNVTYETMRSELVARIPSLTSRWTDYNSSDPGMVLLELFTGVGTMIIWHLDNAANEVFILNTRQRKNMMSLCRLIDYRLDHVVSSTSTVTFSRSTPHSQAIILPKYTRLSTAHPVIDFVIVDNYTWPAGALSIDVGVRQGILIKDTYTSTGAPDQYCTLGSRQCAQGTVEVYVDGIQWTEVTTFVASESLDEHFVVETDAYDATRVFFGNGMFGKIPPQGSFILAVYLESLGDDGGCGENKISIFRDQLYDALGQPVSGVSITASEAATGGADKESINKSRLQAPWELQALHRAVTKSDYEAWMTGYPGVAQSQAWGEQEENPPNIEMFNRVKLVFLPNGGGFPTTQLKTEVLAFLEARKVITTYHTMLDPVFIDVEIDVVAYLNANYDGPTIQAEVESILDGEFNYTDKPRFEEDVRYSNIVRLVDEQISIHHAAITVQGHKSGVSIGDPVTHDVPIGRGEIARKMESVDPDFVAFRVSTVARGSWTL